MFARALAGIAIAVALTAPSIARADTDVAGRFDAAAELMASGDYAGAAEAFAAIAAEAPDADVAPDALFSAGRLYEERLSDPSRAASLYRTLSERYPDSRTALAASRRLAILQTDLGPDNAGAEALARFIDIQQQFWQRSESESISMMEKVLADYPSWAGAPRAVLWLANIHQRAGRLSTAAGYYEQVLERWPESDHVFRALRGAGDTALQRDRFDEAEDYYRRLPATGSPDHTLNRANALYDVARMRTRAHIYTGAFILLGLIAIGLLVSLRHAAGSFSAAARGLWPPPTEVLFMAPVAAILVGAGYTDFYAIGPAVAIVTGGGMAVAWLSGAGLAAAPQPCGPMRAAGHVIASLTAVLALCYIALHRGHLLDLIIETVRFGPDV
jgi:TolA-binding protein